jgi:acetylornithine/succinyldiaminopimelate/putrescine aminotransferase
VSEDAALVDDVGLLSDLQSFPDGMVGDQDSDPVLAQLLDRHIIALPAGPNVIRLLPPLVIKKAQLDRVIEALQELLA